MIADISIQQNTKTIMEKKTEGLQMKREIGLIGGISIIAGTMIGSGIFMSPQFVLSYVGSPGASLLIWALSGILSMFAALCFTELGTVFPESGGEYIYILRTYGSFPAFLSAMNLIVLSKSFGQAAISISIAEYTLTPFFTECAPPPFGVKCLAAGALLLVAIVNCLNVRLAIRVQVVFLVAKVLALTIIAIGGIVAVVQDSTIIVDNLSSEKSFVGTGTSVGTFGMAFYQGLWSFSGWANLNFVTEELKRPEVNLQRAIILGVSLVTVLYLLVNVSYLSVMTPKELMSSNAVALTWGNKVLGSWGWIMSVAAALSAFGSLNGSMFAGGRIMFVASREGHLPEILSMAHVHRLTPAPSLILSTSIALVVLMSGDFEAIVNYSSFASWFFYAINVSGVIYLRIKKPALPRPYKVFIVLPVLVIGTAIFLVLAPILDNPQIEYLYVALFFFSGICIYIPFIHYKICPRLLTKLTLFLQLFLEVAPAKKNV
ncbi:b(0,+)-type amino acid transporter 1-like [Eucyclogobius newberryi]|uniref:b(0,+)-type amino acid transporter 1-like n=1 Tax=Eucyclogobius newberryi TaxID=166745 RepID=UPI003B5CB465